MTRGRKKDMTIPPTRALTQQRDYRARRAQYVSDLEDKCHALEAENTCLRQEVAALRTRLPAATAHNPAVVETSTQLLNDLSAVTQTLSRFQHLVFAESNTFPPPPPITDSITHGGIPSPVSTASPPPDPHYQIASADNRGHAAPRFPRDILCGAQDMRYSYHDEHVDSGSEDADAPQPSNRDSFSPTPQDRP